MENRSSEKDSRPPLVSTPAPYPVDRPLLLLRHGFPEKPRVCAALSEKLARPTLVLIALRQFCLSDGQVTQTAETANSGPKMLHRLRKRFPTQSHSRRSIASQASLPVEALEDRLLLAAALLDSLDEQDLRDAINSLAVAGPVLNQLTIVSEGTIQLTSQLVIPGPIQIIGPGADKLTIMGSGTSGVVEVNDGDNGTQSTVELQGLTITGGNANFGGGIINVEDLTLRQVAVRGNTAVEAGGILSTIGSLTVVGSEISGNSSLRNGGGITVGTFASDTATASINNTTVSGNSAEGFGGGVDFRSGPATVRNSTITGNRSDADDRTGGSGGGIFSVGGTTIHNTIVAGNFVGSGTSPSDLSGPIGGSFNLIGDAGSPSNLFDGNNGNIVGVDGVGVRDVSTVIDTNLANNRGAPTRTHNLFVGPAVNAGNNAEIGEELFDQTGEPFGRVMGGRVDIGAVEFRSLSVNTTLDETDEVLTVSLREAVAMANLVPGFDQVSFAPNVTGETITLTQGELRLTDTVNINGSEGVTISGGNNSRVFNIGGPGANNFTLSNLTIRDGNAPEDGGGILFESGNGANDDTLTLEDIAVRNNQAARWGGGIRIEGPTTIRRAEIAENSAQKGGGIGSAPNGATSTFENVTISGNTTTDATDAGAGVYANNGVFNFTGVTIANNTANNGGNGGGIFIDPSLGVTVNLVDSIVADNVTTGTGPNVAGTIAILSDSVIEGENDGYTFTDGGAITPSNQFIDPALAPLGDYGGKTRTHALRPGSVALDWGRFAWPGNAVDQRGFTRVVDADVLGGTHPDSGAFESTDRTLDIDGGGQVNGIDFSLMLRFLRRAANPNITNGLALPAGALRSTDQQIVDYLTPVEDSMLDPDASGSSDAVDLSALFGFVIGSPDIPSPLPFPAQATRSTHERLNSFVSQFATAAFFPANGPLPGNAASPAAKQLTFAPPATPPTSLIDDVFANGLSLD